MPLVVAAGPRFPRRAATTGSCTQRSNGAQAPNITGSAPGRVPPGNAGAVPHSTWLLAIPLVVAQARPAATRLGTRATARFARAEIGTKRSTRGLDSCAATTTCMRYGIQKMYTPRVPRWIRTLELSTGTRPRSRPMGRTVGGRRDWLPAALEHIHDCPLQYPGSRTDDGLILAVRS